MSRLKYFLIAAVVAMSMISLQGCVVRPAGCYGYYCHGGPYYYGHPYYGGYYRGGWGYYHGGYY